MRRVGHLSLQLVVVGALGIFSTLALFAASPNKHFVGTYESDPIPAGQRGPTISLSLGADGSATVTQNPDVNSPTLERTDFGHWTDSGGQITVTFDPLPGKPAEPAMVFESSHGGLQAMTWNHSLWGKITPPVAKRSAGDWHAKPRKWPF